MPAPQPQHAATEATEQPTEHILSDSSPVAKATAPGTGSLVVAGTFWLLAQTLGSKAVMLVGQLLLAWLLSPDDFGQIGLAYTVLAFVTLLINPGIDVILVRRGRRFHLWSTPAFYFSVTTGLLGCALMLAVAPLAAKFYQSSQMVGLLSVLALATPVGSLMLVPTAKLRSEMRFGTISIINFVQSILQTLLTVGFAAAKFGVYSFVLPMPIVYAAMTAVLWWIARPTIKLRHPLRHWRYLIGDSAYIFGQRVLQTAVGQGDYIVLGALAGAAVVGPYFFAYGIAVQAIRLTAGPLQLVLMAGLSRLPDFSQQQTRAALRATNGLTLIGIPLCLLQAVVARPLLVGMYSDKWIEAVPLVQLISIAMAVDVATWPAFSLLQSRGQFRFLFFWSCVFAPLFIVFIILGALWESAIGVALALNAFYLIASPLLIGWVFHKSHVEWREIVAVYARPIAIGVFSTAIAYAAIFLAAHFDAPLLLQAVAAAVAGLLAMALAARVVASQITTEIMVRLQGLSAPLRTRLRQAKY